jgi:hypothetical protein
MPMNMLHVQQSVNTQLHFIVCFNTNISSSGGSLFIPPGIQSVKFYHSSSSWLGDIADVEFSSDASIMDINE